jgi:hypothetical protein
MKTKTTNLNQIKTPLIIYDSESNMVISNIIEKNNNNSKNGNYTSVLINPNPHIPISPGFQNLCKMNFVSLV